MKPKDALYLKEMVEQEGFGYLFIHYSDFPEIEDEEFHHLRRAYETAHHELAEYLGVDE